MAAFKLFTVWLVCVLVSSAYVTEAADQGEDAPVQIPENPDPNKLVAIAEEVTEEPSGPHWSFNGEYPPERWSELFNTCRSDNTRQSPIGIDTSVTLFDDDLGPVRFHEKINRLHKSSTLSNKGYTVKLVVPHDAHVETGTLPSDGFKIAGAKFTWGSDDSKGSEHRLNGKSYPLEMRMYAYDASRYEDAKSAMEGNDDSLAVFVVLFEISEEDNVYFQRIIVGLKRIKSAGQSGNIRHVVLTSLLPEHPNQYYRYYGSMTQPPCSENVIHTVFAHTNAISAAQLEEFRKLEASLTEDGTVTPLVDNVRPLQPIGDRLVYRSFLYKNEISRVEKIQEHPSEGGASSISCSVMSILLGLAVILIN